MLWSTNCTIENSSTKCSLLILTNRRTRTATIDLDSTRISSKLNNSLSTKTGCRVFKSFKMHEYVHSFVRSICCLSLCSSSSFLFHVAHNRNPFAYATLLFPLPFVFTLPIHSHIHFISIFALAILFESKRIGRSVTSIFHWYLFMFVSSFSLHIHPVPLNCVCSFALTFGTAKRVLRHQSLCGTSHRMWMYFTIHKKKSWLSAWELRAETHITSRIYSFTTEDAYTLCAIRLNCVPHRTLAEA